MKETKNKKQSPNTEASGIASYFVRYLAYIISLYVLEVNIINQTLCRIAQMY